MQLGGRLELHKPPPAQLSQCPSGRQVSSSQAPGHSLVDLVVYQYAKFGALNQRVNKTRSSENRSGWLLLIPRVQYHDPGFSILNIIWLSDPFPMIFRESRTIMSNSLHIFSALYASWPHEFIQRISTSALYSRQKISLKIKFQRSCFVDYLDWPGQ